MKNLLTPFLIFLMVIIFAGLFFVITKRMTKAHNAENNNSTSQTEIHTKNGMIVLPEPSLKSNVSIEEALKARRSTRYYGQGGLSLKELSQLLWSAQGITNERGYRTAPSAGATFPLELYVVVHEVEGLSPGFYKYHIPSHKLEKLFETDVRQALSDASHGQPMLVSAAANIVFTGIFERTASRYGDRAVRYVYNEIGHASQNVHLQAVSLNLGTVVIGAYIDEDVNRILKMPENESVLYMMPVGRLPN